jgi:hypothetical protein
VAAAAALLLSSCGETSPGAAAVVNGTTIPQQKVDDFALVLCSLGQLSGGSEGGTPSEQARQQSLQILMGDQLALDMTDPAKVDRAAVNGTVEQLDQQRDSVPTHLQGTFDEVVREFALAQNALVELGRSSLEQSGQKKVADEAAFQQGSKLRTKFARSADIDVDPRFGTVVDGVLKPGNGSLSVPVSQFAKDAAAPTPSSSYVAELPASQKCG